MVYQSPRKSNTLTTEIRDEIIRRFAAGETIRDICRDEDMPSRSTVYMWIAAEEPGDELKEFQTLYRAALRAHALASADECIEIADDNSRDELEKERDDGSTYTVANSEFIQRSKLRVETRLKLIEKRAPDMFGPSLQVTGAGGRPIEISDNTTREVGRRLAFALALGMRAIEGECSEKPDDELAE